MRSAARAAGAPVRVVSGYRSYATQEATFNHWVQVAGYQRALRVSARPGHSEHQLGTSLDLGSLSGGEPWYGDWGATAAGRWMAANAWRYGFVMSYPNNAFATVCYDYEPWHWRYVGRAAAYAVRQSGLTLREWLWLFGTGDALAEPEIASTESVPLPSGTDGQVADGPPSEEVELVPIPGA
jgi:D-alanyl-D-alanine carboxypeptidase